MAGFWDNLVNLARDATDGGSFTFGRSTGASREPARPSQPRARAERQPSRSNFAARPAPSPPPASPARGVSRSVRSQAPAASRAPAPSMVFSSPRFNAEGEFERPQLVERTITPREESAPQLLEAVRGRAQEERSRRFADRDRDERAVALTTEQYTNLSPMQRAAVDFNTELLATRDSSEGGRLSLDDPDRRDRVADLLRTRDMDTSQLDEYLRLDRAIGQNIIDKMSSTALVSTSTDERGSDFGEAVADARSQATATVNQASMGQAMGGAEQQVLGAVFDEMVSAGNQYTPQDVVEGLGQLNQASGTQVTPRQVWEFAGQRLRAADQAEAARVDFDLPAVTVGMETLDVAEIRKRYGL